MFIFSQAREKKKIKVSTINQTPDYTLVTKNTKVK